MKPHRHRKTPQQSQDDPEGTPVEVTEEVYQPEPVPPAAAEAPNVVPPAQEAPVEQVYDYTQGGDQPAVYEQPQPAAPIDPFASDNLNAQPVPVPPAQEPVPVPPAQEPVPVPPAQDPVPVPPAQEPEPQLVPNAPKGLSRSGLSASRKKGTLKTAAGPGAAAKRPGYTPGRPGQPKFQTAPSGTGFSLLSVLMMIIAGIMLIVAILVVTPSSLKHVKGYAGGKSNLENKEPKNLLAIGQQVMIKDEQVTFTETEVNQYLAGRLKGNQKGLFGGMMSIKGVCVDFSPGVAEVFIERSFIGIPVTMSSRVKIVRFGNETRWESAGGRIGKLNTSGKQFEPVLQAFLRLARTCSEEVSVIDSMTTVKFEKDKILLDSR